MSYHCSLQAFSVVGGPSSRKFFLPPDYQQSTGYSTLNDLWTAIGQKPQGEWRLATKFYVGQFRGLDSTFGVQAAFCATKALVVLSDQHSFVIGHKDNFERIELEREKPEVKPKVDKVHEELFADFV